jgi:SWI/SNF-related matrix-associated actin-dependent regulator of chromatin subfamily A member 5
MGVPTKPANIHTQDVDETPDYTEDSDTNPNTTASSVVGEPLNTDGRKRRSEATQLRRSVFGKKHDILGESKVSSRTFDP